MHPLVATYRLQLGPSFRFHDAEAIVPYLRDLGVSHLYLSPCFEAAPGSSHGYDVVDPNRLREELGGASAFADLVSSAHDHGLGLVLDIVPHHMAASEANAWWWSVLARGRESPYSSYFDIDWDPREDRLRGLVVLPVLGDHYGRVLEAGDLRLAVDDADEIVAQYFNHRAPLSAETADELWAEAGRRRHDVREVIAEVNRDIDRLDEILTRQHHRFVRWQAANHDLDYRRFFDIDSLVALRTERPIVFDGTHTLTAELLRTSTVDGIRVDHVDGLREPDAYLSRLRSIAADRWLVVETILRGDEEVPEQWPIDGTTGYEFLADTGALLVDPDGAARLEQAYAKFTGDTSTYDETAREARRDALRDSLDTDVRRVVNILVRVCEQNRRWRDFTRAELRDALTEICVHAPGYRSYVRPGHPVNDSDVRFVTRAVDATREARPDLDAGLLDFLAELLLGRLPGDDAAELVARFQQLTGPVAAKGEEDTAFYRWVPLLCLNEVGHRPDRAAMSTSAFHERNAQRQQRWPRAMLTTSTHDTKRSEDVRARLAVLSERPDQWAELVDGWHEMNERHRDTDHDAPDRRDEWFVYQTLVGAHPIPVGRAWPVVEKSLREAKRRTDWIRIDAGYEAAVRHFVEAILGDDAFLDELDRFVASIDVAGKTNALTQVALRLLSPGVPDTYQGCELWDSSLVDPDNRRPVDYGHRARALAAIGNMSIDDLWNGDRTDGHTKLALIRTCLSLRRRHGDSFGPDGSYAPLRADGHDADRVIAFDRGGKVVLAAARWPDRGLPDDVDIELPHGQWTNVVTGKPHTGRVRFGELRGAAPLAVLERHVDPVV